MVARSHWSGTGPASIKAELWAPATKQWTALAAAYPSSSLQPYLPRAPPTPPPPRPPFTANNSGQRREQSSDSSDHSAGGRLGGRHADIESTRVWCLLEALCQPSSSVVKGCILH